MESHGRELVRRWAPPVGALAVATIAVLLVHNGLSGSGGGTPTTVSPAATTAPTHTTTRAHATTKTTTTTAAQFYVVQSGDTFGSIAARYGTSVAQLESLNPGVSSNALTVGQRIRVK
jgi:LysM repeat protein